HSAKRHQAPRGRSRGKCFNGVAEFTRRRAGAGHPRVATCAASMGSPSSLGEEPKAEETKKRGRKTRQWGRRVHSAKRREELRSARFRRHASMGSPSSLGEEQNQAAALVGADSGLQWGRRVHSAKSE